MKTGFIILFRESREGVCFCHVNLFFVGIWCIIFVWVCCSTFPRPVTMWETSLRVGENAGGEFERLVVDLFNFVKNYWKFICVTSLSMKMICHSLPQVSTVWSFSSSKSFSGWDPAVWDGSCPWRSNETRSADPIRIFTSWLYEF